MKVFNKIIQVFMLVVCISFLFISCENFFSPVKAEESTPAAAVQDGTIKKGTVQISLNTENFRTILPNAPQFEEYRLEFDGSVPKDPISASSSIQSVSLEPGEWTITAYGRVMFDSVMTDVASGSTQVTITEGTTVSASITVKSGTEGGQGKFSWSLSAPLGIEADSWSIKLVKYNSNESPVLDNSGSFTSASEALNESGNLNCAAGYYVLQVQVGNDRQRASRMEIVHIHSGLETKADLNFTQGDFTKLISVSGTLNLSSPEGLLTLKDSYITIGPKDGYTSLAQCLVSSDGTWEFFIQTPEQDFPIRFDITGQTSEGQRFSCIFNHIIPAGANDITDIVLEKLMITVSGTLSLKQDGDSYSYDYVDISIINEQDSWTTWGNASLDEDGSWVMLVPSSSPSFKPSFHVFVRTGTDYKSYNLNYSCTIGTENINGVNLVLNNISISGSLQVNVDGIAQDLDSFRIILYKQGSNSYLGETSTNSDGTWSILAESLKDPSPVYFQILWSIGGESFSISKQDNWILHNTPLNNIALDLNLITISGSVSIKRNGVPVENENLRIDMRSTANGNFYKATKVEAGGTWSMMVEVLESPTLVRFSVYGNGVSSYFYDDWEVYQSPLTGIYLYEDKSSAAVSGSLSAGTSGINLSEGTWAVVFSETDDYLNPIIYSQGGSYGIISSDGSWTMTILCEEDITWHVFVVRIGPTGMPELVFKETGVRNVTNAGLSNVSLVLSDLEKATKTLSGTITGFTLDQGYCLFCGPQNMLDLSVNEFFGILYWATGSSWTMEVRTSETPYEAYLLVMYPGGYYRTTSPIMLGTDDVTGIELDMADMVEVNP